MQPDGAHGPGRPRDDAALDRLVQLLAGAEPSTERILAHLCTVARDAVGADGVAVLEVDVASDSFTAVQGIGSAEPYVGLRIAIQPPPSLFREVMADGAGRYTNDGAHDPRVDARFREPLAIRALAALPIVVDGALSGLLTIVNTARPSGFDEAAMTLLQRLADHSAIALRSARLLRAAEAATAAAREAARRAEAAARIARAALDHRRIEAAGAAMLGVMAAVIEGPSFAIGVARGRDGRLHYVATTGDLAPLDGHAPAGRIGVFGVAPGGHAVLLPSLHAQADDPTVAARIPDGWTFVQPLLARETPIGVLLVHGLEAAPLAAGDEHAIRELSTSLALALDVLLLDEQERQARDRERLLATALATLDDPVFILEEGVVRYANLAGYRTYRAPAGSLVGRDFGAFAAPVGDDDVVAEAAADRATTRETRHRRDDGATFPAVITEQRLRRQDGVTIGSVVTVRDVSHERAVEAQLRQTEKMVAIGELVAGVAHEISNPLTGISAFAELLLEEPLDGEAREWVELIKRESDRAAGVMRDLLQFARSGEDELGPVDLHDLVAQTLRLRAYALRTARIEAQVDASADRAVVRGNAQKLQQVLLNLIVNAEHAMRDSARRALTIRTRRDGDEVALAVTDTGRGMSSSVRDRIFEPFFTTKPSGMGTGLGLSVSYGIVRAHGGRIDVDSAPGRGAEFRVVLPLDGDAAAAVAGDAGHGGADGS